MQHAVFFRQLLDQIAMNVQNDLLRKGSKAVKQQRLRHCMTLMLFPSEAITTTTRHCSALFGMYYSS